MILPWPMTFDPYTLDPWSYMSRNIWSLPTDIEKGSQNSYTAPCNVVVSHGAPIRSIRVFLPTTQTKCAHDPRSSHIVSRMFILKLGQQYIRTGQITTVIVIVAKTQIPSNKAPCRDKDGAGPGIASLYFCLCLTLFLANVYERCSDSASARSYSEIISNPWTW